MSLGLQYLLGTGLFDHGHASDAAGGTDTIPGTSGHMAHTLNSEIVK